VTSVAGGERERPARRRRVLRGYGSRATVMASLLLLGLSPSGCQQAAVPSPRSVVVVGSWTGSERVAFQAVLDAFTAKTGEAVEYVETRDLDGVIRQRLADGEPVDVGGVNGPQHLIELARSGLLKPLSSAIDVNAYKSQVAPTFVEMGSVDGRLYGAFIKSSVKGLIWYNPRDYQRGTPITWDDAVRLSAFSSTADTRPWCVGLASGASSGWPGTDWIETILIHQSGADVYDSWVSGQLAWSSTQVRRAFEIFGQVVADDAVFGGSQHAIDTEFTAAGAPLFTQPPGCLFLNQGSFMVPFLAGTTRMAGTDFDFFPFPEMAAAYDGSIVGGGDLVGLFSDNPGARDLIAYLVSAEGQSTWVATGGGVLSVNSGVSNYPTDVERRAAGLLISATAFRFDGSDEMPTAMSLAFMKAVLDFTRDQRNLPQILASLDDVRLTAYGQ
jgi:alpha-glucoside transport system substrate-binding protein